MATCLQGIYLCALQKCQLNHWLVLNNGMTHFQTFVNAGVCPNTTTTNVLFYSLVPCVVLWPNRDFSQQLLVET